VARDHLMRFCVLWPRHFGRPSTPLPSTWRQADAAVRQTLFGATGRLPGRPADFDAFLAARTGVAGPLHDIAGAFRANEAVADALQPVGPETAFSPKVAVENSIAARHAAHPVMVDLAARFGRGPLWRAVGRAYDLEAALDGGFTAALHGKGRVTVPAARGLYALCAAASGGLVTAFERVTPTDHLLAPDGILARTLASLPADRTGLAPLILDILDPCSPVRLEEAAHA
ncbi:MAG: hydrogenase expression/formation protein HupK, partial [Pseudomonadota bacterium]